MTDKDLAVRLNEINQVANKLERMIEQLRFEVGLRDDEIVGASLEKNVKKYLDELGIPQSLSGYVYLTQEIVAFVLDPKSKLYNNSVTKFSQPYSRVERAIRLAKEKAFRKKSESFLVKELFGGYAEEASNKEFIVTVANYIRDQM